MSANESHPKQLPRDVKVAAGFVTLVGCVALAVAGIAIIRGERQFIPGFVLMALTGCTAFLVASGLRRFARWAWWVSVLGSGYIVVMLGSAVVTVFMTRPAGSRLPPGLLGLAWLVQGALALAIFLPLTMGRSRNQFGSRAG